MAGSNKALTNLIGIKPAYGEMANENIGRRAQEFAMITEGNALAGGVAGVRSKRPILGGVGGGMAGLAAGQVVGQLLEGERRRRNAIENESNIPEY